jgi:general secretion pathway protein A
MYYAHWGLREFPLADRPQWGSFYESATHEEAIARLHFLLAGRRQLGLLLGEPGVGKSMVLGVFAAAARRAGHRVASLSLLAMDAAEMLTRLGTELGQAPPRDANATVLWQHCSDRIVENRYQKQQTVILLDDADEATPTMHHSIARLVQLDAAGPPLHTVILAARADDADQLGPRLLESAQLRVELERWQQEETIAFVHWALARAGAGDRELFETEALIRLHELSGGLPRRVVSLVDLALVAGAGGQLDLIDSATVEISDEELSVPATASRNATCANN